VPGLVEKIWMKLRNGAIYRAPMSAGWGVA
jgi:hypothetical protein